MRAKTYSDSHGKQNLRVLVFTATYNESENIPLLVRGIWSGLPNADILVVDDNSPDGTGSVLDDLATTYAKLKVIHRPGKLGLGSAHYMAMLYAISSQYDILVTMDADLSHDPADIPHLISKLNGVHFVIGSRYAHGGSCDYKGYRKHISVIGNLVARILTGIPLHEFTTSFRVFDINALSNIKFDWIGNFGYSFFLETVYRLHRAGLKVREEPVHFYNRHSGVSKIPKLEILRAIRKVLMLGISRLIPEKNSGDSQLVRGGCNHCGGHFLYMPIEVISAATSGREYKLAKCLQCGQSQNFRSRSSKSL